MRIIENQNFCHVLCVPVLETFCALPNVNSLKVILDYKIVVWNNRKDVVFPVHCEIMVDI